MDEAMDLVRQELGSDAVIVESKEIARRRLLPWPSSRPEIEVSVERLNRPHHTEQPTGSNKHGSISPRTVRTLSESLSAPVITRELFSSLPELPAEPTDDQLHRDQHSSIQQRPGAPVSTPMSKPQSKSSNDQPMPSYHKSLESLQTIVAQLERQSRPRGMTDVPAELFQQYRMLIDAEVDDDVARELLATLRQHLSSSTVNSAALISVTLTALIERELRCAPPIQPRKGRREIVTVVGPTGVGKTTTIAKLASHFQLRKGLRVGLITVDTYRVGAIEQLQTYADILQIPLRTASTPAELRIAIDSLDDVDLILIDTAGRSPFDAEKLNSLQDIVQMAGADHVLLVLSLTSGRNRISQIVQQFASAVPTSLVLTKLDEVAEHGGLLSIARDISLPVSYITTGQDVPEDFEPAHVNRLARLILGLDEIRKVPQTQFTQTGDTWAETTHSQSPFRMEDGLTTKDHGNIHR
jgi:flagellar biosynthesis protein FlhF